MDVTVGWPEDALIRQSLTAGHLHLLSRPETRQGGQLDALLTQMVVGFRLKAYGFIRDACGMQEYQSVGCDSVKLNYSLFLPPKGAGLQENSGLASLR